MILKLTPALLGGVMLQRALHFSSEPDNTTTKHGFFFCIYKNSILPTENMKEINMELLPDSLYCQAFFLHSEMSKLALQTEHCTHYKCSLWKLIFEYLFDINPFPLKWKKNEFPFK
jgi:hypothetical protein